MTTLTVDKTNAQEIVQLILQKSKRGAFVIDLYDDADVGVIDYADLSAAQQKKYDDVDLVDESLYTDA